MDFNIRYTTLLSHYCLYGCPRVVSAPIQMFIALSVQLCGDYVAHRGSLYLQAASGLSVVTVVDSRFCDRLKVDLVEAQPKAVKETVCFHITQDIPLIILFLHQGPLALRHASQESLTFTTAHCFLICLQHHLNS